MTETFFLPEEISRRTWCLPAEMYNLYRTLYSRNKTGHVFVPIRTMQFMSVLDRNEIIFVDSQSYAVSEGKSGKKEGGRMILVAWQFPVSHDRKSLDDAMSCEVVFYGKNNNDLQLRLINQFRDALQLMSQRYRDTEIPSRGAEIVSL